MLRQAVRPIQPTRLPSKGGTNHLYVSLPRIGMGLCKRKGFLRGNHMVDLDLSMKIRSPSLIISISAHIW